MKQGLSISFTLHLLLFGFLYILGNHKEVIKGITSVEMVSLYSPQKTQRQRIRGSKNLDPKKSAKDPQSKEQTPPKSEEKLGNDTEEAPEILGGSQNPQLLAVASYAQELKTFIEKNRFYPRRALVMEQTGVVTVRLKINARGEFISVEVVEASDYALLNQAATDLITKLGQFKPLPTVYRGSGEFIVPINYQLGQGY